MLKINTGRIEVENIKRQPDKISFIHRLKRWIEKSWPDPEFNADYQKKVWNFSWEVLLHHHLNKKHISY